MAVQVQSARSRTSRASRLAFAACSLLAFACNGEAPSEEDLRLERALRELEGVAFVPSGMAELGTTEMPRASRALLVDRFEVTRAQFSAWLATDPEAAREFDRAKVAGPPTWPAVWMNYDEARAFAESRQMRLPTAGEWFFIAMGPRGQDWPWDQYAAQAVSNTQEIGLGSPSPVGVFEQGRTEHGVYDLIGNVWEWVDGGLPSEGLQEDFTWSVGGAFNWPLRELYLSTTGFNRQEVHRAQRSNSIGLRCVADAETYLVEHAEDWLRAKGARARLEEVGSRWGRGALPLLRRVCEAKPDATSLRWIEQGAAR